MAIPIFTETVDGEVGYTQSVVRDVTPNRPLSAVDDRYMLDMRAV